VITTTQPTSKTIAFEDDKLIRFHHCDPAGIIFYPQYFILFNELIEDWFTHGLGISFVDQVTKERVSTPIGRVECDFVAASKIGDVLSFRLAVGRIGTSSIRLNIEVRHDEEVRVRAMLTVVRASLETLRSVPISQDLRRRMERYLAPAD
jgi:4-hydroxybenzoyl-CoA thioesterase